MKSIFAIALALSVALWCPACSTGKNDGTNATRATSASREAPPLAPGPSIYPLSVSLRDQHDRAIGIDTFRGHPVVISMFYGSCPTACPMLVSHMRSIEASLSPAARSDVRFLLVSFDPTRDTPAALAFIAKARGLDEERWTLATGKDDNVRQIAAVLGMSYRATAEGAFVHDSILTVLDREGSIIAKADDGQEAVPTLATAIETSMH